MNKNMLNDLTRIEFNPIFVNENGEILPAGSIRDSKSVLAIRAELTHSGKLNNNAKFYLPSKMAQSVDSLLKPYKKPILINHDPRSEPLGRITNARYVDIADQYFKTLPNILVKDANIDESNIKVIKDYLNALSNIKGSFKGLGYIEGVLGITDADTKEKICDERYLTLSVHANSPDMYCAACGVNWMNQPFCGHMPGQKVQDSNFVNFAIPSTFNYTEVSFVRTPADEYAMVTGFGDIADSVDTIKIQIDPDKISNLKTNLYMYVNDRCYDLSEKDLQIKDSDDFVAKSLIKTGDNMKLIKNLDDVFKTFIQVKDIDNALIDALTADSFEEQKLIVDSHNQLHFQFDYYGDPTNIKDFTPGKAQLHAKLHQLIADAKLDNSIVIGNIDKTLEYYKVSFSRINELKNDTDDMTDQNKAIGLTDDVKNSIKDILTKNEKDITIEDSLTVYDAVKVFLPENTKQLTKSSIQRAHSQIFIAPGRCLAIPAGDNAQGHYNAIINLLTNIKDNLDDNTYKMLKSAADARALLLDLDVNNIQDNQTDNKANEPTKNKHVIKFSDMNEQELKDSFKELSTLIQNHNSLDYDALIGETRSAEMSQFIKDNATYKATIKTLESEIEKHKTTINTLRDEMIELNALHLTICDEFENLQLQVTPVIAKMKCFDQLFSGNLDIKDFNTKVAEFETNNFDILIKDIENIKFDTSKFSINDGLVRVVTPKVQDPTLIELKDSQETDNNIKLNTTIVDRVMHDVMLACFTNRISGVNEENSTPLKAEIVVKDYIRRGLLPQNTTYSDLIQYLDKNSTKRQEA